MTLTQATQFDKLVENYVSFMMDGMDTETMQVMVYIYSPVSIKPTLKNKL